MLVLSRKVGEKIVIKADPPITLVVLSISGKRVCFGLEAPEWIRIDRAEVVKSKCPT